MTNEAQWFLLGMVALAVAVLLSFAFAQLLKGFSNG